MRVFVFCSTLLRSLYTARFVTLFSFLHTFVSKANFFRQCLKANLSRTIVVLFKFPNSAFLSKECVSVIVAIVWASPVVCDKCVECVKKDCLCNLVFLDTARWRRLKAQRKTLKQQLCKAVLKRRVMQTELQTKKDRLLLQLDYIENKQQLIIDRKLQNLKKLVSLTEKSDFKFFSESLIDIVSKQIVFFNLNNK